MKRIFSLFLMVILTSTVLIGCGGNNKEDNSSGEIFNTDNEIVVVSREEGSGTRGAFVELLEIEEKNEDGTKVDRTTDEAIVQMKTDAVLSSIAGNEYSIGYISVGSLNDTIQGVKIDGIAPTSESIKDGSYKIVRPFNIATKDEISPVAEDFINFIMSSEGQDVVADTYIKVDDNAVAYSGDKPSGKIVVAGSSSVTPVMEKLKEAYLKINTNAEVEVQLSDSSAGMQAAMDGTCDIGMASRELKDSETEELSHKAIALDGIAVIVNNNNTINEISSENIKKIFVGEITNWNNVK